MYAHKNNTNDRFIERNINVAKVNWQNSIINVCIHHRMNEITSEQDWLHSPSGVTGWFIRAQTSEVYVTGIVSHPEPKPSPSSFVDPVQILSPPPQIPLNWPGFVTGQKTVYRFWDFTVWPSIQITSFPKHTAKPSLSGQSERSFSCRWCLIPVENIMLLMFRKV